jgi:hypothetical protein
MQSEIIKEVVDEHYWLKDTFLQMLPDIKKSSSRWIPKTVRKILGIDSDNNKISKDK